MFSAVTSAFIVQIVPELQPDPTDLTNVLLLRILQQNTSFDGTDPLAPVSNVPAGALRAQSILFASLSITLFVAFIAVLGKQWILYYTRVTTWGNIVDRGKERQAKLAGLQKWGLHLIMESLPVMLQLALLLFGAALAVYLWGLNISAAEAVSVVTSIGLAFYTCITLFAAIYSDCPFQTPLSILLLRVRVWREFTALVRVWLVRGVTSLRPQVGRTTDLCRRLLKSSIESMAKIPTGEAKTLCHTIEDTPHDYSMRLSNATFWRNSPLFTAPIPKDIGASAGFWLLENSTDFSAASAVAAVFSELQWPSHYHSTTALIRLRDTYAECFRAPELKKSTRLKALQSAAAYYVLYHTQLIWSTSNRLEVEAGGLPPDLPPDLFLHHADKWDRNDVFEHLLRTKDRTESVTSARFLSYIAPYWFCGDSDSTIRFRPSRLQTLYELIEVLEDNRVLDAVTLTDCFLCVGAVMDFPLHPEDLVRVDKRYVPSPPARQQFTLIGDSDYVVPTFKLVVEHIHGTILARGRRRRHTKTALDIIYTLVRKTPLPLVDAAWICGLLMRAARGNMGDDTFPSFLRLSARRKEEDTEQPHSQGCFRIQAGEADPQSFRGITSPETITPEYILFIKVLQNVQACSKTDSGWQDEAAYGGLIAMRDIPRLGSCLPDSDTLETLYEAMEKSQPFRVRKAAYDVVLAAREGWLKSADSRQTLEGLDFPRQLHKIPIETNRSEDQRSFLAMIETLSDDRYWHSYLRGAMDIWLPFRHEGPDQVIRILTRVGELPLREYDGSNLPPDKFLEQLVEDEWAGVPGRHVMNLTFDQLEPLVEVTTQLKELFFTEIDRKVVLAVVEQVIPALEKRRDDGYEGPGEDIRNIIEALIGVLQVPIQLTGRRSAY